MYILAVDTSCDETAASVANNDRILSNVIASQVDLHKKWGGVVPDIARRAHREQIGPVIKEALKRARISIDRIDYFAVTQGPGLALALEVGISEVKKLATENGKPLIPVNHMEAHLLSSFAKNSKGKTARECPTRRDLPALGLLVSGGHTEMVLMKDFGDYELVGETLDDAAGEAFDKVAKMLNLGYPGGPIISEFAKKGTQGKFGLPIPMEKSGDLNFSFSGLKTACLYKIRDLEKTSQPQKDWVYDFCAEFVESVIRSIVLKLKLAVEKYPVKSVLLGGGVISNEKLRRNIVLEMKKSDLTVFYPYNKNIFTDNAAMVAICAYYMAKRKDLRIVRGKKIVDIDRIPNLDIKA